MSSEKEIQTEKSLSTIPQVKESGGLTLSTREDRQVIQAVDAAALARGITRSKYISQAVHRALTEPNEDSFRQLDSRISETTNASLLGLETILKSIAKELKSLSDRQRTELNQLQQELQAGIQLREERLLGYMLSELHNESLGQRKLLLQASTLISLGVIAASIVALYFIKQLLF